MDAQGAIDSLLGRLTTVLVNEAQLLGGVRSDVEFIKDEMESMNGLLLHLTEAQHRDHQVRAWMKQVVGLTRDCEGNVELYIHYVGGRPGEGGHLRRVVRFLRTIPVRHQIATRIKELKVRARDVGDRRQRYGVTVPELDTAGTGTSSDWDVEPAAVDEEDHRRRRAVLFEFAQPPAQADDEEVVRNGMEALIKSVKREPPPGSAARDNGEQQVRVFCVIGRESLAEEVAERVYQHPSMDILFGCKVSVKYYDNNARTALHNLRITLAKILKEVTGVHPGHEDKEKQLSSKLQGHLKGKRFLIVIRDNCVYYQIWKVLLEALLDAADGCHPGSAIVFTTDSPEVARTSSPYKIINLGVQSQKPACQFYTEKAENLGAKHAYKEYDDKGNKESPHTVCIFGVCDDNAFAMKLLLHLLYVNPKRTEDELRKYVDAISECKRLKKSISKQVLMWCYNELPSKYRSCLLYLTIYPQGHVMRTTSLARRWVAERLITTTASDGKLSATEEAEHHLDVLFTRGFVSPVEISAEGDIKSFTLHHEVREFIARIARDVNFVDTDKPTDLANHLSVHNRIGLENVYSGADSNGIVASLPSLATSPQWQLLKVLDLEGCKGLKKHLKSICKILLLRYLSLRNTDVAELPKQIKELQCLETLDIRQTKVRALGRKCIVFPLLKNFLAGQMVSASNDAGRSEDSFSMVHMPFCVQRMKNLEILSGVQVWNTDSELAGITQLLKLRKLGVSLHGKNAKLSDLFQQIGKLDSCLRSLSIRIRIDQLAGPENHSAGVLDALPSLPQFIRSLNISGLTSGLPHLVQELHELVKLTLSETYLKEDALRILGNLHALRCLRLQHKSYTESELAFKEEEFQTLSYLLVGTSDVTQMSFANGAAPKLERIVWSFPTTACLSGLGNLHELKEFEFNGDCNPDDVRDEIERHIKFPVFKHNHNPHVEWQEDRTVASAASSSSAH